jgi:O-antigen/teichoic acid export membrane protein
MTTSGTGATAKTSVAGSSAFKKAIVVAIGLAAGQVAAYLLSLTAARVLGPDAYGIFASMLALTLVGNVLALGLQAAGARRIVLLPRKHRGGAGTSLLNASLMTGLAVTILTALISPLMAYLLHLPGPWAVLLVAANLYPATVFGGLLGVGQGRESNTRFAVLCGVTGAGRPVFGIIAVVLTKSVYGALIGCLVGSLVALAIGWWLTRTLTARPSVPLPRLRFDVLHAAHALFALFVLTNMDVLLARHYLNATQAGMYAAGAVVAKVTFWLPQFVAMATFTRLADHRRTKALAMGAIAVVAIGAAATLFVAVFPDLVVKLIGGSAYLELVNEVWIFAAAGAAYALAQFLLYGQIAASKRSAIVVLWAAVVLLFTLVALFHESVLQIAVIVLCVALSVSMVGVIEMLIERRRESQQVAYVS